MSNWDWIKSATKEDLAVFLCNFGVCQMPRKFKKEKQIQRFKKKIYEFLGEKAEFCKEVII